jgi:catalase
MSEENKNVITTDAGRRVCDNQNSLPVGPRGPVVFEDFLLFEKMAHFNRERVPDRAVHAKGSGRTDTLYAPIRKRPSRRAPHGKRTPTVRPLLYRGS